MAAAVKRLVEFTAGHPNISDLNLVGLVLLLQVY